MSKKLKEIPAFANEAEERELWLTHDTTDYFDYSKSFRATFPNLKPTTQSSAESDPAKSATPEA